MQTTKLIAAIALTTVALASCTTTNPVYDGRPLVPPRANIKVGSLYFVKEATTTTTDSPAYLELLCSIDPAKYGLVAEGPYAAADLDFTRNLEINGALSGLDTQIVSAGLTGKFSDYYEYKLTNAKRLEISGVEADRLFENRAFQSDCAGWRKNIVKNGWAAYQIISITYGDIIFGPKTTVTASGDISLKLKTLTPKLSSSVSRTTQMKTSGSGLVVSFTSLPR